METAKYKTIPPIITKAMIVEKLKEQGCTNISYSGKNERFYYYEKDRTQRIYSKEYLTNHLFNNEV